MAKQKIKTVLDYFICKFPEKKLNEELKSFTEIKANSFKNSYIDNILLENVKIIEESAFENCKELKLAIWRDKNVQVNHLLTTDNLNTYLFEVKDASNKNKKTKEENKVSNLPTIIIQHSAFKSCEKLETIIFPNNPCVIEKDAFAQCKTLRTVVLPGGDTEIAGDPFIGCNNLTIVCKKDDYNLQAYARAHSIRIVEID
ncbi:MAG: leucine-rich repeat domain-containing protein [Spirochaetia bacterium]|nr:leucine-rich repeat domain-containing protein [Spirochaetia bacterium]